MIVNANLTRALYYAKRYDDAVAQAKRTLEIDPRFGLAMFWLDGALRHLGLIEDAVKLRQRVSTSERVQAIARTFERDGFPALLRECGESYKKAGLLVVAARCYAQAGDKEAALTLLESCALRRCSSLVNLTVEPDFDEMRTEPRFEQILKKVDPDAASSQR